MQCILLIFTPHLPLQPLSHPPPCTYSLQLGFLIFFKKINNPLTPICTSGCGGYALKCGHEMLPLKLFVRGVPPKCRLGYCSWLPTRGWQETLLLGTMIIGYSRWKTWIATDQEVSSLPACSQSTGKRHPGFWRKGATTVLPTRERQQLRHLKRCPWAQ